VYEGVVQDLIDELGRLPGVGPKSAQRIAFHLLQSDPEDIRRLVLALTEVSEKVRFCVVCGNVSADEQCRICRDARRAAPPASPGRSPGRRPRPSGASPLPPISRGCSSRWACASPGWPPGCRSGG